MTALAAFPRRIYSGRCGTKSLLGGIWDAPCDNSLILASFCWKFHAKQSDASRAIRVWPDNPNKTKVIWHLVSINFITKRNG